MQTSLGRWLGGCCEVCRDWCAQGQAPAPPGQTSAWTDERARDLAGPEPSSPPGWWPSARLCVPCRRHFAAVRHRCRSCGLQVTEGVERCGPCVADPPPFELCVCSVDYGFPWDRLIARFKFDRSPELAALLVDGLLASAQRIGTPRPQLFVPVPLSDQRLAERGYDQAWELARRLGQALGVPAQARAVVRRFDTRHQAQLSRRERLGNLRGAFAVPARMQTWVQGRHIGVVDDVMTTGATVHEVAGALRKAGAARVDLWVVARTPPDVDH